MDGVTVEYRRADGSIAGAQARILDFDDPDNNDWLAVNQFTVAENKHNRRPDIVLFVNGLPLVVIELKNAADENATIWTAFHQLQTYQQEIPSLFAYNAALVVSDGMEARIGTVGAGREWFKPWRTIEGGSLADPKTPELQVLIEGVFNKRRFLDLIRYFIVFEDSGGGTLNKKMAGYHQFHAVNVAIQETLRASGRKDIGIRRDCISQVISPEVSRGTAGSASFGIPRARGRASPWPSMPGASFESPRWRTRRLS